MTSDGSFKDLIWVCLKIGKYPIVPNGFAENVVYPIVPNGFADQTIPFLNGYFIGNINPTFSDKPIYVPKTMDLS